MLLSTSLAWITGIEPMWMLWRFTRVQSLNTQTVGLLRPVILCTLCRHCPDAIGQVGCLEVEIEQQQQSLVTTGGKTNKEWRTKSRRWEAAAVDSFNHFYVGFHSFRKKFFVHGFCRDKQKQHIQKQNVLILIYTLTLFFNLIKANYHLPLNCNFPFCSWMN